MTSYHIHNVPPQICSINQLADNMRIIFNNIFMIRCLSVISTHYVESNDYATSYTEIVDTKISKAIDESIVSFKKILINTKKPVGILSIGFYQNVEKQTLFSKKIEKVYWEKWIIRYTINTKEHSEYHVVEVKQQHETLKKARLFVQQKAMSSVDNIPLNTEYCIQFTFDEHPDVSFDNLFVNIPSIN